jgi:peptide/nickel transport system substrate-binding protein
MKMKKQNKGARRYMGLGLSLAIMGLLGGCGAASTTSQAHPGPLVVAENTEPTTLNPIFGSTLADVNAESGIFNSLVSFTPHGGFQGSLAKTWSVSSSHKTWTFQLRHGVLWQDGKPFTSKDVVFTFHVDVNPKTAATAVPPIIASQVQSITANGPFAVTITLKHTLPANLFLQAVSYIRIIPEHILGSVPISKLSSDTAFARHPIGTGPLKLVKWVQGGYLKFAANPHYFRGAPHIQSVVMDIVPSPTTAIAQLESGAIDLIDLSNPISPTQYQAAIKHSNIRGYTNPTLSWKNITLVEQGLFKDVYVRQALDYATPKQQLIQTVLGGYGTPAYYSQPVNSWQGTTVGIKKYPFSLAKARQLLTSHGFHEVHGVMTKNGQPLKITLYSSSTDPENGLIARVIKADWGKIGVPVNIRLVDPNAMLASGGPLYSKTGLNAFLLSWVQGPDPESDSYHWLGANSLLVNPAGGNYARYDNSTVNKLLTEGATTFSQAARAPLYHQVDRILSQQVPDIFLWWSDSLTMANKNLTGYDPNAYAFATFWNFQNWRMK